MRTELQRSKHTELITFQTETGKQTNRTPLSLLIGDLSKKTKWTLERRIARTGSDSRRINGMIYIFLIQLLDSGFDLQSYTKRRKTGMHGLTQNWSAQNLRIPKCRISLIHMGDGPKKKKKKHSGICGEPGNFLHLTKTES